MSLFQAPSIVERKIKRGYQAFYLNVFEGGVDGTPLMAVLFNDRELYRIAVPQNSECNKYSSHDFPAGYVHTRTISSCCPPTRLYLISISTE